MIAPRPNRPWLRAAHATSALAISLFVLAHMANHAVGLFGQERHIAFMKVIRLGYRQSPIEPILLALFGWQAISGLAMVIRGWRARRGSIAWIQALSGTYLSLFLVIHVTAVVTRRAAGVDTDFRFAAEGMHIGLAWFFIPYYGLAVTALFTHLGCAAYWLRQSARRSPQPMIIWTGAALGGVFAVLILASLDGMFFPVTPPVAG